MPRSAWVVARSARWKACECALAKPGQGEAGQPVSAGARSPGTSAAGSVRGDGGEALAAGLDQDVAADAPAGEPGQVGEPARRRSRSSARQVREHRASAGRRPRSRPGRRARRASARPRSGCARTAWPSAAGPPAPRRRGPAPVASTGAAIPRRREHRRQPVPQPRVEPHQGVNDSCRMPTLDPVALGARRAAASIWVTMWSQHVLVRRPGVQPGAHRRADRVGAARLGDHLAERGQRPVLRRRLPGREHRGRVGQHRVPAVGQPGGARVVGPAGELQPPPAVRPDALGDPDAAPSAASARPCSTCSSTNAPMLASRSSSGPEQRRVAARRRPWPAARVTPSSSVRARAASGSTAPVSRRLPRQATPNRAPSSSVNAATATGRAGRKFCARSCRRRPARTPRRARRRRRRRRGPSPGGCR